MTRACVAAEAATVLLLLAGCSVERTTNGPAPPAGPPLRIAFESNRPPSTVGGGDVYFFDPATGAPAAFAPNVNSVSSEMLPALSGDGRWMAFNSTRQLTGTLGTLFLYDVENARLDVPPGPNAFVNCFNPSLSYDGRYLAFQSQVGGAFENEVILWDRQSDQQVPLPSLHEFGTGDFDPSLSGDASLIALMTNRTGAVTGFDVVLYDVPGDSLIPLPGINTTSNELGVSLSRDGRYLAFHSNRPGGAGLFDVYVYDRQTEALLPLPGANTALSELRPALSPDGRWLAYDSENDGADDVRLYDIANRRLVALPGLNDPYFIDKGASIAQP
jgi:Tol biopolymer transport system component